VDAIAEGEDEAAIRNLKHLIIRARELNLRIGAEGVRTNEQAARLLDLGVLAARGSFVAESATDEEVDELIGKHATG
jgi:EAL domain-containing protein (putative c-di-GMP-specific phosphodiesterase class I)